MRTIASAFLFVLLSLGAAAAQAFPEERATWDDYPDEVFGGASLQYARPAYGFHHYTMFGWNLSGTQWAKSRFGITVDVSADYKETTLLSSSGGVAKRNIDQYSFLGGPRFRVWSTPKYDGAIQGLAGSGLGHAPLGAPGELSAGYEARWAFEGELIGNYNFSARMAWTLRPAIYFTRFGSSTQTDWKLATGLVYRFGKFGE